MTTLQNGTDCYAQHLAALNQTNGVIATQDIRNENGLLLVAAGTALRPDVAEKILRHKLVAPLETQVALERSLSPAQLQQTILEFVVRHADLQALQDRFGNLDDLEELCQLYGRYPLIVQKLTVLSAQLPEAFETALFCAWLSVLVGRQTRLDVLDSCAVFLAALTQDTGFLHLDPAILAAKPLNPEQTRALQSHPLIAKAFLGHVPKLSSATAQVVAEHHERSDGSGYPQGLVAERMSTAGQLLSVLNEVAQARLQELPQQGRQLGDYLPLCLLKTAGSFKRWYQAVALMIREAELQPRRCVPDTAMPGYIEQRISSQRALMEVYRLIPPAVNALTALASPKHTRVVMKSAERLWFSQAASGLLSEGLARWMQYVHANQLSAAYGEMEEVGILQQDMKRQLQKFALSVQALVEEENGFAASARETLRAACQELTEGLNQWFASHQDNGETPGENAALSLQAGLA